MNYGAGGAQAARTSRSPCPPAGAKVTFTYVASTHVLTILGRPRPGTTATSSGTACATTRATRSTARPAARSPAGTPVTLRFRTFHDDVTPSRARIFDVERGGAADRADDAAPRAASRATRRRSRPRRATSGRSTPAERRRRTTSGTASSSPTAPTPTTTPTTRPRSTAASARRPTTPVDQSWALTVYVPGFTAPAWAQGRGHLPDLPRPLPQRPTRTTTRRRATSATTTRSSSSAGATLPEGYCRNYADADASCPWRFDAARRPGDREGPRGRDYYRRRPQGRRPAARLPRSRSASTRSTSTRSSTAARTTATTPQDYTQDRPVLRRRRRTSRTSSSTRRRAGSGSSSTASSTTCRRTARSSTATTTTRRSARASRRRLAVAQLVRRSPNADTCRAPRRRDYYDGWFGFDSIPVLHEVATRPSRSTSSPAPDSDREALARSRRRRLAARRLGRPVVPRRLLGGASAQVVKAADPDALTISETWQKDTTLLRMLRGDRLDTTMNYRLRDAVLGLLAPEHVRPEGLRRQRPRARGRREFASPARFDPRGLRRRGLLLADEPARQPRHRARSSGR